MFSHLFQSSDKAFVPTARLSGKGEINPFTCLLILLANRSTWGLPTISVNQLSVLLSRVHSVEMGFLLEPMSARVFSFPGRCLGTSTIEFRNANSRRDFVKVINEIDLWVPWLRIQEMAV